MSAGIAAAEAAVAETSRILVSHPPFEERWAAARQHERNLAVLADARRSHAAEIIGDFGIDAYSLGSLPKPGGAR